MTGRSSRANALSSQTITQLAKQTAKTTEDLETKMKILAVKAARYDLKSESKINQGRDGKADAKQSRDKIARLAKALASYNRTTQAEATARASEMVEEAKEAIQHNLEDRPFRSQVLMVESFRNTKNPETAVQLFIQLVEQSSLSATELTQIFKASAWAANAAVISNLTDELNGISQNAMSTEGRTEFAILISNINRLRPVEQPRPSIDTGRSIRWSDIDDDALSRTTQESIDAKIAVDKSLRARSLTLLAESYVDNVKDRTSMLTLLDILENAELEKVQYVIAEANIQANVTRDTDRARYYLLIELVNKLSARPIR